MTACMTLKKEKKEGSRESLNNLAMGVAGCLSVILASVRGR